MNFKRYNVRVQRSLLRGLLCLSVLTVPLALLSAAEGGTFPGSNGQIAFTCGTSVCRINPDGTARSTLIGTGTDPSWSGDGTQIAYNDGTGISVANDDGSFPTSLSEATGDSADVLRRRQHGRVHQGRRHLRGQFGRHRR